MSENPRMDKKTADDTSAAFDKIVKMINRDEMIVFTPEEAKALREFAGIWRQIKAVFVLGGAIGNGMKWLVMIAAAWLAFKGGFIDWIRQAAK